MSAAAKLERLVRIKMGTQLIVHENQAACDCAPSAPSRCGSASPRSSSTAWSGRTARTRPTSSRITWRGRGRALNDFLGESVDTLLELPRQYDEMVVEVKTRVAEDFLQESLLV